MTVTLQIVSPLDQSTILLDLNDPLATNSTSLVPYLKTEVFSDVDMGAPVLDKSQVDPVALDTTFTTFSRRAAAPMKVGLHVTASSTDNLTKVVGTLAQYLSQGCVMKWVPTGATQTAFLDVLPSQTPVLLNGQAMALQQLALLADTQNDLDIEFTRQAYLRFAKLDPAVNLLLNSTILRDSDQDGIADNWPRYQTPTVTIVTATESTHVVGTTIFDGIHQMTANGTVTPAQQWTLSAYVKVNTGSLRLAVDWYKSSGVFISTSSSSGFPANSAWTRVQFTSTAPALSDHADVYFYQDTGTACTFDIRNAQWELATSASPFRVSPETVTIDPATAGMAKMMPVYNPGTAWAPLEITTSFPDASTAVQQLSYGLMSSALVPGVDFIADYLNGPYYGQAEANGNGWTLTAGTDTTLAGAADALASPGSGTSVARITHATAVNTTTMRIRWSRTTLLDCLRGTFQVFVRVKPTATANSYYDLTLKWGTGGTVQYANDTTWIDNSASAATAYRLLYLGNIVLPDDSTSPTISSLQLELWTNMDGTKTAQNLDVDYINLVPTEDVAVANISGGSTDSLGAWNMGVPKQLGAPVSDPAWTAGTVVVNNYMNLDSLNDAVAWGGSGTAGNTGFFAGTGSSYHICTASVRVAPSGGSATANFQLVHFDVGGANPVVDATVTKTGTIGTNVLYNLSLAATDVAGKLYQLRVTYTTGGSPSVFVYSMTHTVIPIITQNQKVRADPGSVPARYTVEQLNSSSATVVAMNATRVPFWIPPGLLLLTMDCWDKQADSNDLELSHFNARTVSVSPAVYPRNWV